MNRATFLVRDGVINRNPGEGQNVIHWEEIPFLPGVADAMTLLIGASFSVVVVSNQGSLAKGD